MDFAERVVTEMVTARMMPGVIKRRLLANRIPVEERVRRIWANASEADLRNFARRMSRDAKWASFAEMLAIARSLRREARGRNDKKSLNEQVFERLQVMFSLRFRRRSLR